MSMLQKLLSTKKECFNQKNKHQIEISRLSEIISEPFIIDIYPLTFEQNKISRENSLNIYDVAINTITSNCKIDGTELKDKTLLEHYCVHSNKELIKLLFNPGEINSIYEEIAMISGFEKGAVTSIKKN